jgi:glutamyl-tRNA synthetase
MVQERSRMLGDVFNGLAFFLKDEIAYDDKAKAKYLTPEIKPVVTELIEELNKLSSFDDIKALEGIFSALIEKHNIKMKNIAQAVRVLLTGTDISPGVFEILSIMGKDRALKRLKVDF